MCILRTYTIHIDLQYLTRCCMMILPSCAACAGIVVGSYNQFLDFCVCTLGVMRGIRGAA